MPFRTLAALGAALFFACNAHAAGLGGPDVDVAKRLLELSVKQEIPAGDARLQKTRDQIKHAMQATGEDEQTVAQACMRNARYIYDVSKIYVSPLEVLEALAQHAPTGKPLTDTTQRYFELRVRQKLDHAGAMVQMAAAR